MKLNVFTLCRFLNLGGDLEDLETALKDGESSKVLGSGSCSALIKLLPGYKDLYVSHDTWNVYNGMLRIIKKTILNLMDNEGLSNFCLILGGLGESDPPFYCNFC